MLLIAALDESFEKFSIYLLTATFDLCENQYAPQTTEQKPMEDQVNTSLWRTRQSLHLPDQ